MRSSTKRRVIGRDALRLVVELLHRVRLSHSTAGVWEAADFEWWWRMPRRSDEVEQLFWLDDRGPLAAAMLTKWRNAWGFDPIVIPHAAPSLAREVWEHGLEAVANLPDDLAGIAVTTRVRDGDIELASFLKDRGFAPGEHDGTSWMETSKRPPRVAPPEGFQIIDRDKAAVGPHWMTERSGPVVEARLRETVLYDPSLDLSMRASNGQVVGYALFWFDPVTLIGMLEPMRVEEAWQRRGLARALISEGLARLADRGAKRFKVSFESDAARTLYLGLGFELESTTTAYIRQPRATFREH